MFTETTAIRPKRNEIQSVILTYKNGLCRNKWGCSYLNNFNLFVGLNGLRIKILFFNTNIIGPNFSDGLNFVTCEHSLTSNGRRHSIV